MKLFDQYAFEKYPRHNLRFPVNRRQLFANIGTEVQVQVEQSLGKAGHRLAQLGSWSDEQLAAVFPVIAPECQILTRDGFVCGRFTAEPQVLKLFPVDSPALTTFNQFNGLVSLRAIAHNLTLELRWTPAHSFAYARGLFLHLVTMGVSIPK